MGDTNATFISVENDPYTIDVAAHAICVDGRWFPALDVELEGEYPGQPGDDDVVATFAVPLENGVRAGVCLQAYHHCNQPSWVKSIDVMLEATTDFHGTAVVSPAHPDLWPVPECPRGSAAVTLLDEAPCAGFHYCSMSCEGEFCGGVAETTSLMVWLTRFAALDPSAFVEISTMPIQADTIHP